LQPSTAAARTLSVDAGRIERWVVGFGERHGRVEIARSDCGLLLRAADGATALLASPFAMPSELSNEPPSEPAAPGEQPDLVAALAGWVLRPRRVAAVLARRGGYGGAVLGENGVEASKVGTRYVQGRTAAGGWSQQRFARRRENQTQDLVRACADVATRLLTPAAGTGSRPAAGSPAAGFDGLLTGGDRPLVERVLADPRLRTLLTLPRATHLALGDPRSDVVRSLPGRLHAVTVILTEEPEA
jgi:Actinobacteria/chloroflexi VLRF1 release factor